MSPRTSVLIDARCHPETAGGVAMHTRSLLKATRAANCERLDVSVLVLPDARNEWILSACDPGWRIVVEPTQAAGSKSLRGGAHRMRQSKLGTAGLSAIRRLGPTRVVVPSEPSVVTQVDPDVVHFPSQRGFLTARASIYQPHDLQHMHYPEYFDSETLMWRKRAYRMLCERSAFVVVGTEWTRRDVIARLSMPPDRVQVIEVVPDLEFPPAAKDTSERRDGRILYPAANWPHKNHERLLHAIRLLIERGKDLDVWLPGPAVSRGVAVRRIADSMGLEHSVHLPGFLSEDELLSLYLSSSILVMPSLFESESIPIWEAFGLGLPVAASAVTAIPDQVGDAALLFDPFDIEGIADTCQALLDSSALSESLTVRGRDRLQSISLLKSAEKFEALYLRAARLQ